MFDDHDDQPWDMELLQRCERLLADPRSTDELIRLALVTAGTPLDYMEVLQTLHLRANREVLEAACALCHSAHARERILGADMLGRLGDIVWVLRAARMLSDSEHPQAQAHGERLMQQFSPLVGRARQFPKEIISILLPLVESEENDQVLRAMLCALGDYQDFHPIVTERLAAMRTHPNRDVRFTVATRLALNLENPIALVAMTELSDDDDDEIRMWTTLSLGQFALVHTEPEQCNLIRDTLCRRLTDANDEVRGEAMLGLAMRSDPRVVDALIAEAGRTSISTHYPRALVTAAIALGDPRLYPLLQEVQDNQSLTDSDHDDDALREALAMCRVASNN